MRSFYSQRWIFPKFLFISGGRLAPDFFLEPKPGESYPASFDVLSNVEDIFKQIEAFLNEDFVKDIGASFYFRLSGRFIEIL